INKILTEVSVHNVCELVHENANVSFGIQFVNPDANLINATSNGENTLRAFNDWSLALRTVF
ncbi:MAG: short chain amide porin, partial [Hydrogenobaculum sp.]